MRAVVLVLLLPLLFVVVVGVVGIGGGGGERVVVDIVGAGGVVGVVFVIFVCCSYECQTVLFRDNRVFLILGMLAQGTAPQRSHDELSPRHMLIVCWAGRQFI